MQTQIGKDGKGVHAPHRDFASDSDGYYKGDSVGLESLTNIDDILAKVEDGGRISYDEAMILYQDASLLQLGALVVAPGTELAVDRVGQPEVRVHR